MTLNQLICRAASVYPEAYVLEYWDAEAQEPKENPLGGDTLARFIAIELADTFDEEADDDKQIAEAVRAMQSAADDLAAIVQALRGLETERKAA